MYDSHLLALLESTIRAELQYYTVRHDYWTPSL